MATLDVRNYDYASFSVPNATTDYDVKTNQTALFSEVGNAGYVKIESTAIITVKFNETTKTGIPFVANEAQEFGKNFIPIRSISNLYITNASGWAATVQVILAAPDDGVSTTN